MEWEIIYKRSEEEIEIPRRDEYIELDWSINRTEEEEKWKR